MDVELVSCETAAGRLHGFVVGDTGPLAVHLHGTWGNFYENAFVTAVARGYRERGWRYASVNLPSHDGGSVKEQPADSLDALARWVETLAPEGGPLVLQGHSLGALKAIQLMQEPTRRDLAARVSALVLLSPFDIVAFYGGPDPQAIERTRAVVAAELDRSGPDATVPASVFDLWQLSAATFMDMTETGGEWDVFPSRTGDGHRKSLAGIDPPILTAIGSDDFAAFPDPATVTAGLDGLPNVTVALVDGAPHAFNEREEVLCGHISRFLSTLP